MSHRIVLGGTTHIMGGRAKHFRERVVAWKQLDPYRAKEEAWGSATTLRDQLIEMIRNSQVSGNLKQFLRKTHEAICRLWVRRIGDRVLKKTEDSVWSGRKKPPAHLDPAWDIEQPPVKRGEMTVRQWVAARYSPDAVDMRFWITSLPRIGDNYKAEESSSTDDQQKDAMWLLKNMRFRGWNDKPEHDKNFKGWCPFEPVERMRQLLTFPINQFGVDMPTVEFPEPPEDDLTGAAIDDLDEALARLYPELEVWEEYYVELAQSLGELVRQLDSL